MNEKPVIMQQSNTIKSISEALSIYLNQLVYEQKRKGLDITVLSLGEAYFDIPMFDFKKLNFANGYHYSDSQGLPALREVISGYYKKKYQAQVDPNSEMLITTGSKAAIYFSLQAVMNPGDELLMHEPFWLSYKEQATILGAHAKSIPYYVEPKEFERYFTSKTKLLVINNPNNPTGRLYKRDELELIYNLCQKRNVYLLVDEAYSDFVSDGSFVSLASFVANKRGVIIVNSLSKNMGMSGWRVGYVISSPELVADILKLNQHIITCAPTILQYYMAEFFDDVLAITLPQVKNLIIKRQRVSKMMDNLGLKYIPGNSTFYFMVSIENFPGSSLDFAYEMLFVHQIAVVPGIAYGASCSRFVRVGIGVESEERIYLSLQLMSELIRLTVYDPKPVREKIVSDGFYLFNN